MNWMLVLLRTCIFAFPILVAITGASHAEVPDEALRLQQVGYRLARANADACDEPTMLNGLMLHDIAGYAPADRDAARSLYGLAYGFGVLGVVKGSMAERAGLIAGDELIGLNGHDLTAFGTAAIGKRPTYARTESFVALLDSALRRGPANLVVLRRDQRLEVVLQPERGCGGWMALMHQRTIDAWSDGRYVAVTQGLAEAVTSDSELAFIVAHEMAHNMRSRGGQSGNRSRFFIQFGLGTGQAKAEEIAADTQAVSIMLRGGFDPDGAEQALRRMAALRPQGIPITHPSFSRRIAIVRAAAH